MRACRECGADISDRRSNARYCVPCAKDKISETKRRYHEANREKRKEYNRKYACRYRAANPQYMRDWQKANPEKVAEYDRRYREANPEKVKDAKRKYREANPEKAVERVHRRRARKRNQLGTVTKTKPEILKAQGSRCAAPGCHKRIKLAGSHLDHIIPLLMGGMHEDANLQVLCVFCNLSKSAQDPFEFARSRGALL